MCVCALPAAPCHKQCCNLQRHFETMKHPEASSFFLGFASFKEKAGVCVFLSKRACGEFMEARGSLG